LYNSTLKYCPIRIDIGSDYVADHIGVDETEHSILFLQHAATSY